MENIKEYNNGEITIVWKHDLCIHAAVCVKTLPQVYNPKDRPWIKQENATTEQLVDQINKCPSGALSFYYNKDKNDENPASEPSKAETSIEVTKNGPCIIKGNFEIKDSEGNILEPKNVVALCRCGASTNKPFCDGSHGKIGFEG